MGMACDGKRSAHCGELRRDLVQVRRFAIKARYYEGIRSSVLRRRSVVRGRALAEIPQNPCISSGEDSSRPCSVVGSRQVPAHARRWLGALYLDRERVDMPGPADRCFTRQARRANARGEVMPATCRLALLIASPARGSQCTWPAPDSRVSGEPPDRRSTTRVPDSAVLVDGTRVAMCVRCCATPASGARRIDSPARDVCRLTARVSRSVVSRSRKKRLLPSIGQMPGSTSAIAGSRFSPTRLFWDRGREQKRMRYAGKLLIDSRGHAGYSWRAFALEGTGNNGESSPFATRSALDSP
jgi:hypothetical protein